MPAIMLCALSAALAASPATQPAAPPGWKLAFTDNPKLPRGFRQFTVPRPDGSTQTAFIADKPGCLDRRLPLLIFVDGSGAHSQFFFKGNQRGYGVYGALAQRAADRFHVATPEKRGVEFGDMGTPGVATDAAPEYAANATWDNRVAEIRLLIDAMVKQPNVDASRIVVLGHSEGADVAAAVAAADPRVTHCVFLAGGGPTQLFDLMCLRRKEMTKSGATPEQIEASVKELEADYRKIFADPDNEKELFMGHAYKRWSSFCAHPPVDSLLKTRANLFLAQGSEDTSVPVESFDLLVCDLIRNGKKNVEVRRYPGRDHSLSPPDKPKNAPPLQDVFDEILAWAARPAEKIVGD